MRPAFIPVIAAGILCLAGCVDGPDLRPGVTMPVAVDTSPRSPQAAPADRSLQSGPVTLGDRSRGREVNFGPESMLDVPPDSELQAAMASLPQGPPGAMAFVADATQMPSISSTDESAAGPETYRLNFEDADIKDVLQAVLGNILKVNYTLSPGVMGRVTISSASAQPKAELLSTLESVLASLGYSLTKTGTGYRVTPANAPGGPVDDGGIAQGYGISVVPLHYTSAASMSKLLSGLVSEAEGLRIDTARNAMIIHGPAPKRAEIARAIASLDVDWMRNQSVSVFELRRAKPDEVVAELAHVFNQDGNGGDPGPIQFKAVPRLRSVMVISKTPGLIKRAGQWIHRLDTEERRTETNIFIYRPRFRDAKELVKLINGIFGKGNPQDDASDSSGLAQGNPQSAGQGTGAPMGGGQQQGNAPQQAPGQTAGMSSASFAGGLTINGPQTNGARPGSSAAPIEAGQDPAGSRKSMLTADLSNNTIVAYTDGDTYAKILGVMRQLDVAPLQVAVNVIIAEVQLNKQLQFGVQFYLSHGNTGGISLAGLASQALNTQSGFNFLVGGAASPDLIINALDTVSRVEILSAPSLVVMENKPATLQVGDQVPVTTQQAQSTLTSTAQTVTSVQYLDTGIILKILPRVGQNGTVAMEIDQEISSVSSGSSTLTPTISKRRITSNISVLSGQTVLLAGLISDNRTKSKTGVPFLSNVPGVGDLLASRDNTVARNEIVVFIRPVVVRNSEGASKVVDEFKTHLQTIKVGQPPVLKP